MDSSLFGTGACRRALAFAAGALWAAVPAMGQSPDWSAVLTIAPTPSPYLADWERVPSTALLAVTYTGTGGTDFRIRATLSSTERGLIGTTESPVTTLAGGPSSFLFNVRDAVLEWTTVARNAAVTDAARRTGQLPEGSYRACARVLVGTAGTVATEACAEFSILQPDPPQLLMPQDGDLVVSTQPFFQWTPVLTPPSVPVSYELTVVELIGTQLPRAALEANIPVLRTTSPTPFLVYPIDALALERTKRYAWRVRAVDEAGRQLFRDGAASEIWSFEMSDDLLRPVGKVGDLPDEVTLVPGVARLRGIRSARLDRTETDVTIDGPLTLEFLGGAAAPAQEVQARGLRLGYRGTDLAVLDGTVEAAVPAALVPASVRDVVRFAPLTFSPRTGFTATAALRLPGRTEVPLTGVVQLTAGGLYGRLEGGGPTAASFARIGRAPVQYAATQARLTLPEGRLEVGGRVLLFEQDVGCPATGLLEAGVARLPVFCDPTSGFRPDTASSRALLTFGTLAGALAADLLTDTLGTELRAPATFSVLGERDRSCAMTFTMVFVRDAIRREDEQQACALEEARADFGWVRLGMSDLRIERLEYAPGASLVWRALVNLHPEVRGAANLQLPAIRDARLDERGVFLPPTSSDAPGTSTSGLAELAGFAILPRTMGFKGGLLPYRAWLGGDDPGLEWGSATSWIRYPMMGPANSACLDAMPTEVDTLVLAGGRLDAAIRTRRWEDGCKLYLAPNLHALLTSLGGRLTIALDSVPRPVTLPTVTADAVDHRADCGVPVLGCAFGPSREAISGTLSLTPTGRLRGTAEGFAASWMRFDLRFAKLDLAGGRLALGTDTTGAQTALYDGAVKVDFGKIDAPKDTAAKADTAKRDTTLTGQAGSTAAGLGSGLLSGAQDTVRATARLDVIAQRFVGGRITLRGPFKLELGFLKFIVGEASLDTTGLTIDGRQRTLVAHATAAVKSGSTRDSTYTERTDTVGATFARVRLDPASGDIVAGTVSFDGQLALESSPLSGAIAVAAGAIGGAVSGGADSAAAGAGRAASSTNLFGFKLVDASGSFDPTSLGGNIRLQLPTTPTLDAQGMRISGAAPARAAFAGSTYDSASVSFENGFAMQPAAGRVTAGRALVRVRQYPIAYLEPAGWRVALGELVQTVLPDTLKLFDDRTAFVVLRDSTRRLLVEVTETNEGPRIRTRATDPLRIVVPALKGSRQRAPQVDVVADLTLERGTWRPLAGQLTARNIATDADAFGAADFPFQLDSLTLRAERSGPSALEAHGRFDVFAGAHDPLRLRLGLSSGGRIVASAEQAFRDTLPLVGGTGRFAFHVDTLRFSAEGVLGTDLQWRLDLPGRLTHRDERRESLLASATFRLSPAEAGLFDFRARDSLVTIALPGVDLRLGRVRAPTFRWDMATRRFDFELLFDLGLEVPALDSLKLPEIRDIRVTPQGIVIPAFEVASTPVTPEPGNPFLPESQALRVGGFGVRPLAFRMGEFRWDWSANAPPPQLDFGVDLEFSVEDLPSGVEGQGARLTLRALDVGVTDGQWTGRFEPIELPQPIRTPVADIRGAFGSFRVGDGGVPDVRIGVTGDLRLPELMTCESAPEASLPLAAGADTLFLASDGTLRGTVRNLVPRCPLPLGPFSLAFGPSAVTFGWDAQRQRPDVSLDASATLRAPGTTAGETIAATGRLVVDIDEARVRDASIAIDQPFFWAPDPANPFLRLEVTNASLTRDELRFGATGRLRTAQGAGVDVAFDSVAFDLNALRLRSGRIRLTADAAVGIEIPDDGSMLFGVYPVSTPRGATASARVVLPQGAVIDAAGLHVNGTATASLGFGGQEYAALAGEFRNDFTITTAGRVAIARGRLDLRDGQGQLIAYADSVGFWPGNVFAVLPVPARLGVPSEEVAYLQLRDPSDTARLLVETEFSSETVRVRTRPGQGVTLTIPALASTGSVPTIQAEFDLTLNARTMRPVGGGLQLRAAPGQSLLPLEGLPVQLTELGFAADTGGFRLRAGVSAKLPGPLADVDLDFRNLEVTAQGLTGTVELGEYSEVFDPARTPIAEARLLGDTLALAFTGAELTLAPNNNVVRISGGIRSAMLAGANGQPRVIQLAATVDGTGFRGTASVSDAETPIPIGVAQLTLENGANKPALAVTATAQEFALVLGGSVRLPTIAPGFALGVEDFSIGTAGVRIPNISVAVPSNTKEFELFGARFALRDSTVGSTPVAPAVAIALEQGVVRFTMSGYVTLLNNTTRFIGLQVGTDGAFALQGADFISRPITIIENTARLTRVAIVQNRLELRGDVRLPAPFAQAPQELILRIGADGTVTGGGRVVIISEAEGMAAARTKLDVGVAVFHLRRLDLEVDFADAANTAVSAVADVYIQKKQENLLRIGRVSGNTVTPGLRIALNGAVTFGGIQMPNPITLDMSPVRLTFRDVTSEATPSGGFAVAISGGIGLDLAGAGGQLNFRNVGFTSDGEVRIGQAQFDGGTFTVQNTVKIVVGRLAWSDSDTSIYVPVARPPAANGEIQRDSVLAPVSSFVDFGASVDIADVFAGGVDRVLVYVRSDDNTSHFLIENLKVEIPGVIDFTANFNYDQLVDGFDLALSTEGTLLSAYRIGLVGVMGQKAGVFRAGLFLRTSLTVPIVPGIVTLTEVGGGLFINPTPNDLLLVKTVAGMNGPSADRVGMPPAGAFAVMLYAGFEVAGTNGVSAAAGRALVTITDRAFQINAMATFFKMNDQLSGDLALQVGWDPAAYVRGDISLVVDIDSTVAGVASVQFFAGSNIFAVKGNVDLLVLGVINAYAEVIVVPSGFTANLGFLVAKQTSVVAVSLGANLRIWYRPSTNDLGAYMKLTGRVTALGVTGEIELIGALVINPELAIYAQGTARIVGVDVLKVEVWVQYTGAGFAAGLGRSEELAAALARAEQVAADLEAEADRILAGIDAAAMERARTPIAVSDASLAAAYQNFQRWNLAQLLVLWGGYRLGEGGTRGGLLSISAADPYVAFYERTLTDAEAAADTALVRQLREEATQKLAVITARRADVEQRIGALRVELEAAEQASQFLPPPDPVVRYDAGAPTFVAGPVGPDGRATMVLANAPQFDLNDQAAADARAAMTAAQAATVSRPDRLRAQISAVEEGLARVMAATAASDPASFASYARLHSDAVETIERQHAVNVDFRMRRRAWTQGKLDTLATQRPLLVQRLNDRLQAIDDHNRTAFTADWSRRLGVVRDLHALALHRARFLSAWAQDPSILSTYEGQAQTELANANTNAGALRTDPNDGAASARLELASTWFRTQALNYGLQDWWGVANTGLTGARDGAQALVDTADAQARPVIRAMRDMHARITTQLGELNARQAELVGVLYDLYDAYLRSYGAADTVGQRFTARKAALAEYLQVPRVTSPRVVVTDFGYLSSVQTTWTGTHPRGVYEHLMREGADSLLTVGAQGTARRWQYTTSPAGGSVPQNQQLLVRGGAGYTGSATTPYTVTFARGSAGNPSSTVATPPADVSAPSMPVVALPEQATIASSTGAVEAWTSDSTRLVATWGAGDPESGIAEYEYRVVSWPLPPTSTQFGTLFGSAVLTGSAQVEHLPWTGAGGRTRVAIQGLALPAGRQVFVEVRARNGAGLLGPVGSSPALRYDATRPAWPAGATTAPVMTVYPGLVFGGTYTIAGYTPPLAATCGSVQTFTKGVTAKVWDGKLVTVTADNGVVGGGATYTLTMSRPDATDPETGIGAYLFRVDTVAPSGALPREGWSDIIEPGTSFTARSPLLVYGRPRWITLVAVNQAGGFSAPLTFGPYTQGDGTGPGAPAFCGDFSSGGFIAFLSGLSTDPETGVRGYQLRVRGPTGAIVRDFPTGGAVDWPASQAAVGRGIRLPVTVAAGGNHVVELRAVNGLGTAGAATASGQVLVDVTPPPAAAITSAAFTLSGLAVNLTLANDLESGIAGVDIAFATGADDGLSPRSGSTLLAPYATYPAVVGPQKLAVAVPRDLLAQPTLFVLVRVRNRAGLVSTLTSFRLQ